MNFLRKFISFVVIVAATAALVCVCISSTMKPIWQMFGAAFSPFNVDNLVAALSAFMLVAGSYIVLIVVGFIGLTIPKQIK